MTDTLSPVVLSYTDLIRRKWRLEAELAAIRRELQSRDARAVDEACNLDIPVNP